MTTRSYEFSHAIVRTPGRSSVNGLRAVEAGTLDYDLFRQHHRDYIRVLRETGANVTILPADEAYPDGVFVEDAALCLHEAAIIMRPGAPTRLGEANLMEPVLSSVYSTVLTINGPGDIEGGDILTTESEILVGLSARTNQAGVDELDSLVSPLGYGVRVVATPQDILHFKTDCSLLDDTTILSTPKLAATGCFDGYDVIHTADGESACANTIRFNEFVIMPEGFPETASRLVASGYTVRSVGNSEAAKIDGGMSCLSLRFSPS